MPAYGSWPVSISHIMIPKEYTSTCCSIRCIGISIDSRNKWIANWEAYTSSFQQLESSEIALNIIGSPYKLQLSQTTEIISSVVLL